MLDNYHQIDMASRTTNYAEIQQDELEVLRSIYMEDFEEEAVKTGAWNKTVDRAFQLTIKATSDGKHHVALTLSVSLPTTYPKTLPRLALIFGEGVPLDTRKAAEDVINTRPRLLLGSEMIYEIATALQDIIDLVSETRDTNDIAAGADSNNIPNLHQERALQEAAISQRVKEAEEEKQLTQKEDEEEEQRTISYMIEQEKARMAIRKNKQPATADPFEVQQTVPGGLQFDQSITIKDAQGTETTFHTVHQKTDYREGTITKVFTVHPLGARVGSAPVLALKECRIVGVKDEDVLKKRIQDLESKLNVLKHLRSHPNILNPINFNIEKFLAQDEPASGGWEVSILTMLAEKGSVKGLLDTVGILNIEIVRAWAMQLLEALEFYHSSGIAHGKVHVGNILLEEAETGNTIVKLSDGLYQHDLHFMKNHSSVNYLGAESLHWSAPEVNSNPHHKPIAASDIWDLGVALLQMIFGTAVQTQHDSPNVLLISRDMSRSLEDFFEQMFTTDFKKRISAFNLKMFEFLRTEDSVFREPNSPRLTTENLAANHSGSVHPRRDSIPKPLNYSRYLNDFVEIGRLGRGGYGEVVKARHKLENRVYAIKKIKQDSATALTSVLSEIVMLSMLNHPNVVRYFTAWTESDGSRRPGSALSSSSSRSSLSLTNGDPDGLFAKSSGGLDFISADHPEIVFGYSDDEEGPESQVIVDEESDAEVDQQDSEEMDDEIDQKNDDEETEEDSEEDAADALAQLKRRRSSSHTSEVNTILYIQMQYCERQTLRDVIRKGLHSNPEESWRLFRQILYGLVHIHENSVVHRDLKPENIFIDYQNDVRIGDFGLARPGDHAFMKSSGVKDACASFTKSIGTAFYVAPEVRSAGKGKYNEKADMYSLGIIFFEMCFQMETGMERAHNLAKIRKEDHSLPRSFEEPEKSLQGYVILSLIQHRSANRPSSSELLSSGQIPAQSEDESIRAMLRNLRNPKSLLRFDLLAAIFSDDDDKDTDEKELKEVDMGAATSNIMSPDDPNWDVSDSDASEPDPARILEELAFEIARPQYGPEDYQVQKLVKTRLASVFLRHGALNLPGPVVHPYSSFYSNYANAAFKLLRRDNKMMQAPYDLTLPHAKYIAYDPLPPRKSFTFGDVFRDSPEGEPPKILNEVDFDIVSYNHIHHAAHEAEIIKIVDEVIDAIPSLATVQLCFHINHSLILDAILKFCRIDKFKRPAVKEELSKLHVGDWTWAKLKHNLRAPPLNVAATSLAELQRFDFRDRFEQAISRLRSIFPNTMKMESAYAHLRQVTVYLGHLDVKRKVFVNPLGSFNEKFYRGEFLFQCIYDKKERDVFAAGGRYDRLIKHFRNNPKLGNRCAVGFSMNWQGLCPSMVRYHQKALANLKLKQATGQESDEFWITRRCDVLIDSFDFDLLLSTGMKIAAELWSIGVSAEVGIDVHREEESVQGGAKEAKETYTWVILIKNDGILKIKNLIRKDETELRKPELIGWLRSEIRDRDRHGGRHLEKGRLLRHSSNQDSVNQANDRDADVRVLMSQNKGKKVNRKTIVEEAQSQMQELVRASIDGPMIAAIETKDEIFDGLRATRLTDADTWKKFVQNAPPNERQYLGQVHQLLKDMARDARPGATNAFIYNFRTKNCIAYDLGPIS